MNTIDCKDCKGTGKRPGYLGATCPVCHGFKKMPADQEAADLRTQKIRMAIFAYGIYPVAEVMFRRADAEQYEQAHIIRTVLQDHCRKCHIDASFNSRLSMVEDFQTEFWRLGMSGVTAVSNYANYINAVDAMLMLAIE